MPANKKEPFPFCFPDLPEVQDTDERMVFSVASTDPQKPGKRYRVDLLENGGAGWCSCTDFSTRRMPAIKRGEKILRRATSCIHHIAAVLYFDSQLLPDMSRRESRQPTP